MTRRYNKFEFGFLNTAQDSADLKDFESANANNLDPDKLALGTLEHNQFATLGSLKDFEETSNGNRVFKLGNITDSDKARTTYIGTGSYVSGEEVTFPDATPFFWAFDVEFSSTSDGYVIGNYQGIGELGIAYFEVASGDLVYKRHDGTSFTTSITAVTTIVADTPYRVVVSKGSSLETVYVNGSFAGQATVSASSADLGGDVFSIGDGYTSGASFDLGNMYLGQGEATEPYNWDASTLTSVKFSGAVTTLASSRTGNGLDSVPELGFASSGTAPVTTDSITKGEGTLFAELSPSDTTVVTQRAYTTYYSKFSWYAKTDEEVSLGSAVYVRFFMKTGVWFSTAGNLTQTLFQFNNVSGAPERLQLRFNVNTGDIEVRAEDSLGFSAYVPILAIGESNEWKEYVFVMYSKDGTTDSTSASVAGTVIKQLDTSNTPLPVFNETNSIAVPDDISYTGSGDMGFLLRDISVGTLTENLTELSSWSGTYDELLDRHGPVEAIGAVDGSILDNTQGITASNFGGGDPNVTPDATASIPKTHVGVADGMAPPKPETPTVSLVDALVIDDTDVPSGYSVGLAEGKTYGGPADLLVTVTNIYTTPGAPWEFTTTRQFNGGQNTTVYSATTQSSLGNNILLIGDTSTSTGSTGPFDVRITAPELLDGDYKYKVVAVRTAGVEPANEIESIPSDAADIKLTNVAGDGGRSGNFAPRIELPGVRPGYPDYIDRYDIYRADPDTEEYIKIKEHSSTTPLSFTDTSLITSLDKVEFLRTDNDESFSTINSAISNDSGNFYMTFEKDNRIWLVPSDRKDLLLYSRQDEWWGWARENSFSFNGDIIDVVTIRDISVVSGETTLVVFTTKGIYHIVGAGVESSPYTRVPMFGGDGYSEIDMFAGSALPFNGSVFFMSKSSDGNYDTGAYGQKVYEYNLQQLVELSGRIRENSALSDGGELEFASLIGGDKYILKKLTNDKCLVYHKDARGWLTYDVGTTDPWTWESKRYDRRIQQQGTWFDSSMYKIDYEGSGTADELTLTFWVKPFGKSYVSKFVQLSNNGRTIKQGMLPANMGEQWYFTLTGNSDVKVYNMWFVS